jgi:hypothetical protein
MAAAGALLAPSASLKQFGRLGSLPGIHPRLARSRRPSALAMQMGLVPGGGPYPEPIPQVCFLLLPLSLHPSPSMLAGAQA